MNRDNLKKLIKNKSGSITKFCKEARITRTKMHRILSGRTQLNLDIIKICHSLDMDVHKVLNILFKVEGVDEPARTISNPVEIPEDTTTVVLPRGNKSVVEK